MVEGAVGEVRDQHRLSPVTAERATWLNSRLEEARAASLARGLWGTPLARDVQFAVELDWLIQAYGCDGVVETGTYLGDTTVYLAMTYPQLSIHSCEIDGDSHRIAATRLAAYPNTRLRHCASPQMLADLPPLERPLYYLDAHWQDEWPLLEELAAICVGVVCVHDFDIGDPNYGFDAYRGIPCGARMLGAYAPIYGNDPAGQYTQAGPVTGRIGRGYLVRGLDDRLGAAPYFRRLL